MSAENVISQLQKVRRTGPGRWIACCPAHNDKSPSLSVTELDDGRLLIHCHAECGVHEVLQAIGLTFDDLFPERLPEHRYRPTRIPASDVLACLHTESLIMSVTAANMARGVPLSMADRERSMLAASRIAAAIEAQQPRQRVEYVE